MMPGSMNIALSPTSLIVSAPPPASPPSRPAVPAPRSPGAHTRTARSITARFEGWFFPGLAARLPGWILPDHLTVLGLVAATGIAAAYCLSGRHPAWLAVAALGLVVHWLADSLDGTLARVRRIQRPRYGFYLDHICDAYATFAIGIGLGLSPYMLLAVSLAIVVGYLVLSINVYLETHVLGEFRYGYGRVGPTEARAMLIVLNLTAVFTRGLPFDGFGIGMTVFDVVGVAAALGMVALVSIRVRRNLRTLGRLEPPNVVKSEAPRG